MNRAPCNDAPPPAVFWGGDLASNHFVTRARESETASATRCGGESIMLLTKHEGETFRNQTVYISGQAFIRCQFVACTLVLRETVYHLEGCTFERCNWHVDWVLMWGSPESVREIKALVGMIEQAQQQQGDAEAAMR